MIHVAVSVDQPAHLFRDGEDDPVGQLEAALLAQRVDGVDELVRLALEQELVVEPEVERDRDAVARGDRPALAAAALYEHLVRVELMSRDLEAAVGQLLEVARRERLAHGAELLAELRAELRQVRLHPELDRLDGPELDLLHPQLVGDLVDMAVEARRPRRRAGAAAAGA